ncbi:GNAT family N-acetyltransferase [Chloroflexota bacterium]
MIRSAPPGSDLAPRVREATVADVPGLASLLITSFPGVSLRAVGLQPIRSQVWWQSVLERTWGCGDWLVIEREEGSLSGMGWLATEPGANPLVSMDSCREFPGTIKGYWRCWKLGQLKAPALEPGEAYLDWMAIAPEWRRAGFGHKLLEAIVGFAQIRGAPALKLDVETANAPAITLYQQSGFRVSGTHWKPMLTVLYGCGQLTNMVRDLT